MTQQQMIEAAVKAALAMQAQQNTARAQSAGREKPSSMSDADFQAHVQASEAETEKNAAYDADPRAYVFALEQRIAKLEAPSVAAPAPTPPVKTGADA